MEYINDKRKIKKLIIALVISLLIVLILYIIINIKKPSAIIQKDIINNTTNSGKLIDLKSALGYLAKEIGATELHNPPLSKETPKIKFIVDSEIYTSEINNKQIIMKKEDTTEEDIIIKTTKQEIANAISSKSILESIKTSIVQGKTTVEMKASYLELYSKGYVSLYKSLTGKSLMDLIKSK